MLRHNGYAPAGTQRTIHALAAEGTVASRLEVADGTPLLRVRSATWDVNGSRFDYYETWVRTDVVPLEVNVSPIPQP